MNKKRYLVIMGIVAAVVLISILFYTMLANHRLAIASLEAGPERVLPSGSCQIVCIASDHDGDELSYNWSADGGEITGEGAAVTWTAPNSEGSYNVTVTVTDGRGGEVMKQLAITVGINKSPTINNVIADADWTTPSGSLQVTCDASDPDGDELSYNWSADGGEITGEGAAVTWTAPNSEGSYNVTVTVTDGRGGEVMKQLAITVGINKSPTINNVIADADWTTPSGSLQVTCIASDHDGDELSYNWSADGGEITGEGAAVTWTAPNSEGSYNVTVTVTDGRGGEVMKQLAITVGINKSPTINNVIADADWTTPSGSLQVTCDASDPDGDELSYNWSADGGGITGEGATVTWTAPNFAGSYNVAVTVIDGRGGEVMNQVTITVGPADRVEVVYFHRTQRCHTCLYAEEQTRYTLETYFADELASGRVTFQSINVQDEANADIVEKYNNASYLTLCINTVRDGTGHIEEVTDIWLVIGNDEAFVEIVKSKVEKSLSGEV